MDADLEERLPALYQGAKNRLAAPREVHRRLQFLERVLRHATALPSPELVLLWLDARGEVAARSIYLPETVIGREAGCDVMIDDPCVSRRHCVLRPVGGESAWLEVEDLGSSNGTRINGRLLPEKGRGLARDGDVLELGGFALALAGRVEAAEA